jgi:outer membrane receptor protein involved in Fe transport
LKKIEIAARLRCGAAPVILATALLSPSIAFAQEAPQAAQEADDGSEQVIVVTGSRIVRPDLEAASPVTTINAEAFKATNAVSAEKLLSQSPQFLPAMSSTTNNDNPGVATIDIRGLGEKRTLVLVNGKRMVSYDSEGIVDVNSIPIALISRVDVLTGGASAVYGSDAVSGVVNFVLNDKFTGLRLDGASELTTRGDGAVYNLAATGGLKLGDRGNIVVSGAYTKRKTVYQSARKYADPARFSDDLSPGGSSSSTPTVVSNTFDTSGNDYYQIGANNEFVPYYQPYNYAPPNYLVVPQERYNVMGLLSYELTDGIEFFGRASYMQSKVDTQSAPTATFGYPFSIFPDNPYLTPATRDLFFNSPRSTINSDGSTTVNIRRRIVESGGRTTTFDNRAWQVVGGLRGKVSNLDWEVFAQYSKTKRDIAFLNDITKARVDQALDAVSVGGVIQCRDPSNGCVPVNLFTTTPLTQQQLDFMLISGAQIDKTNQFIAGGSLSGDIGSFTMPWTDKPVAFAVGVEYRREEAQTTVDANYASGDLIGYGQGFNVPSFSFNTKEAFGELRIPLITEKPFFESLGLELGYRYSDYSSIGSTNAFKAGGDWSPVRGVRFRGMFQRSVRAPNIYELSRPRSSVIENLAADPCQLSQPVGNAVLTNLCIATGAPASSIGSIAKPVSGQVNAFYSGNLDLKAEKSDTITLGVVLTPAQVPGLTLSVDYFNIKIKDAIDQRGGSPQNVVEGCYLVAQDINSEYCQAIVRNSLDGSLSGDIVFGVDQTLQNTAVLQTKGVDVGFGYRKAALGGTVNFSLNGTWLDSYTKQGASFAPAVECAGRFGFACNIAPMPKWKHVATLSYGNEGWSLEGRWRFIGKVKQDVGTNILVSQIKAQSYFDLTATANVSDRFTFRLGVQNLLDKQPPIVGSDAGGTAYNSANTFPTVYDALGATVFAGFTANF